MMKRCPNCEASELRRIETILLREVAGHKFRAKVPATVCGRCGERFYDGKDLSAFDDAVALALADAGITTPEAVRYLRKALGLTATELSALLSVRPETVSRWENGKREIDRATFALLRQLIVERRGKEHPVGDFLRRLSHPKRLGKTTTIKLAS